MFDSTRRKFLAGFAAAFAAPMIVRASSIMPVRAIALEPIAESWQSSDTLDYQYWAIGPMGLAKYSAKQLLAEPRAYVPWLPQNDGLFRPVLELKKGLLIDHRGVVRNIADRLKSDPVYARLRREQAELLDQLKVYDRAERAVVEANWKKAHLI